MANKSKLKVYFDTTCFIDAAQHQMGVSQNKIIEAQVWFYKKMLEASRAGDIEVFTSMLTVTEALFIRDDDDNKVHNEEVKRLFKGLLTSGKGGVTLIQPHLRIVLRARDFRWKDGVNLKPYDSVHLACALDRQCSEFITTDPDFLNKADVIGKLGTKPILAPETIALPAKYRTQSMVEVDGFVDGAKNKRAKDDEKSKKRVKKVSPTGGDSVRESGKNPTEHTPKEKAKGSPPPSA